jgi:hypothetical protein
LDFTQSLLIYLHTDNGRSAFFTNKQLRPRFERGYLHLLLVFMNPDFDGPHRTNYSARPTTDAILGGLPKGRRYRPIHTTPGKSDSCFPNNLLTYLNAQATQNAISLTLCNLRVTRFFHTHTFGQFLELMTVRRPRKQQLHDAATGFLSSFAGNVNDKVTPHRIITGGHKLPPVAAVKLNHTKPARCIA